MVAPVVASVASASSNSSSYAVSVPTGTTNGDLLIGVVASDFGTFAGNSLPTASWTRLTTSDYDGGTNAFHVALYARVASSEPATYTVSHDNSDSVAAILRVTGWDSGAGIAGAVKEVAPSTTGTGTTAPSITPWGSDDLLITFHGAESSSGGTRTWTPPTGMTEHVDRQSTTWASLEVNSLANPSTPSGTKVATPSASVDIGAACTISIKAAGGGTGVTATPAAISVTVAAPQATPSVSDTATPDAITAVVSLPQASPSAASTVSPSTVPLTAAIPQVGVAVGAGPAVIPVTVSLPQASPQTGGNTTVAPATIATTVTIPRPNANITAGPAQIAATVALPQSLGSGADVAEPAVIPVTVAMPAATPNIAAGPAAIVAAVTLPAAGGSVAAGTSTVTVLVTIPQAAGVDEGAQVNGSSTPTVTGLQSTATVAALAAVAAVTQRGTSTPTVSDG